MPKIPVKFGSRNQHKVHGNVGDLDPFFSMSQFKQHLNVTPNLQIDALNSQRESRFARGALGESSLERIHLGEQSIQSQSTTPRYNFKSKSVSRPADAAIGIKKLL